MNKKALSLEHQEFFKRKLFSLDSLLSEYSFANLYLFRHIHQYEVVQCQEEFFIKGITRDKRSFIMPTSLPSQIKTSILKEALSLADFLFPISDEWLSSLEKSLFQASFNDSESDYLFKSSKMANYPGRHLGSKRNLIKQLFKQHKIRSERFEKQVEDAKKVLSLWQGEQSLPSCETDYFSCLEALEKLSLLGLEGHIVYSEGEPVGFIIGEWISAHCYVIHFTKALHSLKGLYPYLYQDVAQSFKREEESWINMEQDLGLPPLRQTKHSYLPDRILKKWRVVLF